MLVTVIMFILPSERHYMTDHSKWFQGRVIAGILDKAYINIKANGSSTASIIVLMTQVISLARVHCIHLIKY